MQAFGPRADPARFRRTVALALPPTLVLAVLVGAWQLIVDVGHVEPYLLPSPAAIGRAFWSARGSVGADVATTATESVLGLLAGAAAGGLLAAAIAAAAPVRRSLYPLLVGSQTIPMIVLAPLLVLWFGYGITPKVVVVALIVFFPVVVATVGSLASVDLEILDLVRSMGASRVQRLRTVLIPAGIPGFFSGLRISAAYTVAGAVVGEWVGAQQGLGIFIDNSKSSFRIDRVFVAVVIIAALSMLLFAVVSVLGRIAAPWLHVTEGRPGL